MNSRILLFTFVLVSCITGPKSERKSKLNYLNGEHYNASPATGSSSIMAVPIAKRRDKASEITGSLFYKDGVSLTPLNRQKIVLTDSKGNRKAEVYTEVDGRFKINEILKNGTYRISVESKKYSATTSFTLQSYKTNDLKLIAISMNH